MMAPAGTPLLSLLGTLAGKEEVREEGSVRNLGAGSRGGFLDGQNRRQNHHRVQGCCSFRVFLTGEYIYSSISVPFACSVLYSAAPLSRTTYFIFTPSDRSSHPPQYHNDRLSLAVLMHTHVDEPNPSSSFFDFSDLPFFLFTPRRCLGLYLAHLLPPPPSSSCSYMWQPFCSFVNPHCT